jgi:serine/threonine-protein kinase
MSEFPKVIHRYEIVDRLGRGGMGELYLGKDPLLDRFVAIKVLRAGFEGDDLRERFAREAKSAARLQHVNIVTIYDVGDHAGQPYIAMEYVRGETMFQVIQRKMDLPLATKLQYIDELCAGLAHAHKAGIVHRDIKPANLMITTEGALKILDFGIARLVDSSMTQAGMVMGTLNYMSPEQITGQPIDQRSDIFAVGAVFYELIAYQQAFPGGIDSGVLSRIMEGKFTPLERVTTRIDKALARVIDKALAKNPDDRYPDLTAMRDELARVRQRMDPRVLDANAAIDPGSETVAIDTPVATPRTPRRGGTNRDEIQRRRAEELAGYLASAREAFAAEKYEEASAACERALIIEPDNDEALHLSERARTAIEQHQVREWITEARSEFESGNLVRARDLVSFVLSLDSRSTEARSLRTAIEQAQRKAEIEEIVGRGRVSLLSSGDVAAADAALQQAFALDPSAPAAVALQRDIEAYVEAERRRAEEERRRAEVNERVRELLAQARRLLDKGELDNAVARLDAIADPLSDLEADVAATLQDLRTEARVIREREAERERQVAAELQQARTALAKDDLIAAAAAVARARGVSPAHQEVTAVGRAIDARRAEIAAKKKADEDAQRQAAIEAKRKAEDEARRKVEEDKRRKAEEQARRQAEDEARRKADEEARRRAEEERQRKADEERRRKVEEDTRKREEAKRKAAAAAQEQTQARARAQAPAPPPAPAPTPAPAQARAQAPEPATPAEPSPYDTVTLPPLDPRGSGSRIAPAPVPAPAPIIKGGGAPPIPLLAAVALLAVVVIGGGIYWLTRGDDAPPQQQQQQQASTDPATGTSVTPPATTDARPAGPMGMLVIDAAPWAEIVEITGPGGRVAPAATHTPLALSLPEGEYRVTLRNPSDAAPRVVTVRVAAAAPARAFAEFKAVDVDDYFRRAGS